MSGDANKNARRRIQRAKERHAAIDASKLDGEELERYRLREAKLQVQLESLSPPKLEAPERVARTDKINAGDRDALARLFR